ncbi:MAG: aminotransferase class V-fold PLP-dependent enzyme [Thermomicrobiales bacterium]|nr:aminotransferase class V-fold PLP-dependent enzyme [Thermomicrobiales bacterium]MCO5222905.1 aminotransferase class V-fold PLP-dependent enzyme [Thermomicrobiales bacterium]
MNVYERFGVKTVINAAGTQTRAGGTLMDPEVTAAMSEAARNFVRIDELQDAASRLISEATGAEAGYVTSGASAGITLAVAASIAGIDVDRMNRLPDTSGMAAEVIVQRPHRNAYDHAARVAGARLVEVGTSGFPGRGASWPWQVEAAITERTTAMLWPVSDVPGVASLAEVSEIAHRHDLDVIVDAAAALPPVSNLRRFIDLGADVVIFSGGKAIRGPQSTGIVAGRADLIESIALQHQDMDVYPQTWSLRGKYLESGVLPGPPHHGIGRGFKVGKEEIVGLMVALERYLARDHEAEATLWLDRMNALARCLDGIAGVTTEVLVDPKRPVPVLRLHLDECIVGKSAYDMVNEMAEGDPPIILSEGFAFNGVIGVNPLGLQDGEEALIAERLKSALVYSGSC